MELTTHKAAADGLAGILQDRKKRAALKRASTYDNFKSSWHISALLGGLHQPPADQLLVSLWAASTVKENCEGSLARRAREYGINERHWQKLTSTRSRQEAARQVRRIARQLPSAPIRDIVEKLYFWGPSSRRRWAMEWFDIEEEDANDV